MADYKRMVSYMYQYENGTKKKNVGYARVEAKNGECKITLHMQLPGLLDSIFPTYLIQRKNEDMELVYLGDSVLKNQVMDSKLTADEANIMASGYGLSDMGGILLFLNEKVFYATEWDDKPVVLSEVMEALKEKPKKEEKRAVVEEKTEVAQIQPATEADTTTELPVDTSLPYYKLPRGYKTYELQNPRIRPNPTNPWNIVEDRLQRLRKEQDNNAAMPEDTPLKQPDADLSAMEPKPMTEQIKEPVTKMPMETVEDTIPGQPNSGSYEGMVSEPGTYHPPKHDMEQPEHGTAPQPIAYPNMDYEKEEKEKPENPVAARLFESYPRIYPFEDNEIAMCVKIEPKDIGYLPVDAWILSNNSFLLHGYYCYNHLIFAKKKDRFGCCYILGVPGIYHNRERFMARMFGFENFKSIRKRDLRQGDFGYWYITLSM